jgi:HlyD family secretion protein
MASPAPLPRPVLVPPSPAPAPPRRRLRFVLILCLLGAAIGLSFRLLPNLFHAPPPNIVRASGRIEGREVTLAPKDIQGRVKKLLVDEGAFVQKGQVLAELESKQLDARYAALKANIANIDAQIRQAAIDVSYTNKSTTAAIAAARAAVSGAQAHIVRAKAIAAQARAEYERALSLYKDNIVPKSTLDQADMAYQTSQADVDAAEKGLTQAEANLGVAQAAKQTVDVKAEQVKVLEESRQSALAQLAEAEANLAERTIVAPADGTILSRPVEVGDVVSPGSPVFVMVDMNRLYLKVYVPEPDIPKLKLGDAADVSVDAFPGRTFAARVSKIYQQAEFTPKNVETADERVKLVFGVELSFVNPEGLLKPGMPADGAIHWTSTATDQTRHEP